MCNNEKNHRIAYQRPEGLEPATFWFVARHSIQLSYERTLLGAY